MRRILIVDDDEDLLSALCELFVLSGADESLGVRSLQELEAKRGLALDCEAALIDVQLSKNGPTGVDIARWLVEQGFDGQIAFLTGHPLTHPLVQAAKRLKKPIIEKPIGVGVLQAIATGAVWADASKSRGLRSAG